MLSDLFPSLLCMVGLVLMSNQKKRNYEGKV